MVGRISQGVVVWFGFGGGRSRKGGLLRRRVGCERLKMRELRRRVDLLNPGEVVKV